MPPRSQPSERQRRLGAELKRLRMRAHISGDQAAALIDADRQRVSNIESGRVDVPRNGLHKLLRAYDCPEGPFFEGLMAMAQDRGKGWWDAYRDAMKLPVLDLAELEARATTIRANELLLIPGLLQTADYARAVCEAADDPNAPIDRYVEFRLARQRILSGESPVRYHAVIHEGALQTLVGSRDTMRAQLSRLIEVARLPNVTVQIFPFQAGPHSAVSRSFAIFGGPTPELDTVRLEQPVNSSVLREQEHAARYARIFAKLAELALPSIDARTGSESHERQDSLRVVQHLLHTL
ncbi:helix-turn-helix domain-containing protein [Streptomyces sp. NPDC002537]